MRVRNLGLAMLMAFVVRATGLASAPVSLPSAIVQQMIKGKRCDLVWTDPGFDRTRGVRIGKITNDSDDDADVATEYFPIALAKYVKGDSPYQLHIAVVRVKMKTKTNGSSEAQVRAEGRFVDQGGSIVAAFVARATERGGGNEQHNARLCARTIVFAMAKDLLSASFVTTERAPEIIVSAPGAAKDVELIEPSPKVEAKSLPLTSSDDSTSEKIPVASSIQTATSTASISTSPSVPAVGAGASMSPVPPMEINRHENNISIPTVASQASTPLVPKVISAPTPAKPTPVESLIPSTVLPEMKRGRALARLWVDSAYKKTEGFSIGEVRYQINARNDGIDKYLPEALAEIAKKDAPCILYLRIVDLKYRTSSNGGSIAIVGVEGALIAKDGKLLAAFKHRESAAGIGDSVDDCRTAARGVILAIAKDLL